MLAWASLGPPALAGQVDRPSEPRARVSADTTLISVGDRISYSIVVEHPSAATVLWPDSLSLAPFEILDAELLPMVSEGARAASTLRLSLTVFELGDLQIPSVEVGVVDADSSVTYVATDAFGVSVVSVGLDEGGEIRDIKGPLAIQRSLALLGSWLLLAVLALGASWWWWRRRAQAAGAPRPYRHVEIPRAPHVIAYEALDELEASDLLVRGEIKAYHVVVSEIIRTYVEGRYRLPALELTSRELLLELEHIGVEGEVLSEFRTFLHLCDLVKFAKLRPAPADARATVDAARHLVDETKPRFEAPASPPDMEREHSEAGAEGELPKDDEGGDAEAGPASGTSPERQSAVQPSDDDDDSVADQVGPSQDGDISSAHVTSEAGSS